VNGDLRRASARIQGRRLRTGGNNGALRRRKEEEDNAMMRTFASALLATALIAGPAFAASPAGDAGKTSVGTTLGSSNNVEKQATKPGRTAKAHHARKHIARHEGKVTNARHLAGLKTHRRQLATHVGKPMKVERAGKSDKS
jgi:hypothetical protein